MTSVEQLCKLRLRRRSSVRSLSEFEGSHEPPLPAKSIQVLHRLKNHILLMNKSNATAGSVLLRGDYSSPSGNQSFHQNLPPLPAYKSVEEKTAYLSALRISVGKLQEEVNTFLTEKMAQDKASTQSIGAKTDDKQEEETYGEEVVDTEV